MRALGAAPGVIGSRVTADSIGNPARIRGAATILDRLAAVKQTGPGRWLAKCPAHDDRSPSLSIRELDDGRILLHDFGACQTADVLAALGLEMSALFPEPLPAIRGGSGYGPTHSRLAARDVLEVLDHEITVAVLILDDILARRNVSEDQVARLTQAASRIGAARDLANPQQVRHAS